MLLINRTVSSSKGAVLQLLLRQNYCQVICPVNYNITTENLESKPFLQKPGIQGPLKRLLHVTKVNRDIEAGLRALGAGISATGVIGSGIGLGLIFGNLMSAIARNPSVTGKVFGNAIMGAAFCEALALFALVIAFIVMP